jgi:hypothetical protein
MTTSGSSRRKGNAGQGTPRRRYRFSQTGSLVAAQVRKVAESRGFAQMRLLTDWEEVVGAEVARLARPEKVGYARQGMGATLHVSCIPGAATEIQMMREMILERVNACYGYRAVTKLRIVQAAYGGFAEPKPTYQPRRKPLKSHQSSPETRERLRDTINSIEDEGLRKALSRLDQNMQNQKDR